MNLQLNGVPVTMEVNTSVTVSLMSQDSQRHFFHKTVLDRPTVRLYNGSISIVGTMMVQVKYLSYVGSHTLYICGAGAHSWAKTGCSMCDLTGKPRGGLHA